LLASRAHRRERPGLRLCADRGRDETYRRAQTARRQDRQSRRPRAGVGLRSRALDPSSAAPGHGGAAHPGERMSKSPKYFMYFPGNYRWSAAFVNMLGRASYGGADISELHKIGRLLDGKSAEDDEAWFDACVEVADEVRQRAERFRAFP